MASLTQKPEWVALQQHYDNEASKWHMREMFDKDSERFKKFSTTLNTENEGEVLLDYSKNIVTEDTMKLLVELARACDVEVNHLYCLTILWQFWILNYNVKELRSKTRIVDHV